MDGYQVSTIVIMIIFYTAYFIKGLLQKRKGIQTSQLGKGKKARGTLRVEMILGISTMIIVLIEIISIYLDAKL